MQVAGGLVYDAVDDGFCGGSASAELCTLFYVFCVLFDAGVELMLANAVCAVTVVAAPADVRAGDCLIGCWWLASLLLLQRYWN